MWMEPKILARSVYDSLSEIEKRRVSANIKNYGTAFIKKMYYTNEQAEEFIAELKRLLEVV